jgi:hypothetical protein
MMKKEFTLGPRTLADEGDHASRGRGYRRLGRIFLIGAALGGAVEMVSQFFLDGTVPPVTLRTMLDAAGIAHIPVPIGLILDLPLWMVLLFAAAIPYAMAVYQFDRHRSAPDGLRR